MVRRIAPVAGLIRASVPALSTISQTSPAPVVIPPSAAAGPTSKTAVKRLPARSTLASDGIAVHMGIQRLPKPVASPAQGSPGRVMLAASLLVFGSIRCTAKGPVLPTHTASAVIATQSAVLPRWIVASGVSSLIDLRGKARPSASTAANPDEQLQIASAPSAARMRGGRQSRTDQISRLSMSRVLPRRAAASATNGSLIEGSRDEGSRLDGSRRSLCCRIAT